jgi:hypothetical protein
MNTSELESLLDNRDRLEQALETIENNRNKSLKDLNLKFDMKRHRLERQTSEDGDLILEEVLKRFRRKNEGKHITGEISNYPSILLSYKIGSPSKGTRDKRVLSNEVIHLPKKIYKSPLYTGSYQPIEYDLNKAFPRSFLVRQETLGVLTQFMIRHTNTEADRIVTKYVYFIVNILGEIQGVIPKMEAFSYGSFTDKRSEYLVENQHHFGTGKSSNIYLGSRVYVDDSPSLTLEFMKKFAPSSITMSHGRMFDIEAFHNNRLLEVIKDDS